MIKSLLANKLFLSLAAVGYFVVVATVGLPCIFHKLTGLFCPGCGATRAVWSLTRGDLGGAVHQNGWLICLVIPLVITLGISELAKGKLLGEKVAPFRGKLTYLTAYAAIAFFILRNLPFAAFDILRPF